MNQSIVDAEPLLNEHGVQYVFMDRESGMKFIKENIKKENWSNEVLHKFDLAKLHKERYFNTTNNTNKSPTNMIDLLNNIENMEFPSING